MARGLDEILGKQPDWIGPDDDQDSGFQARAQRAAIDAGDAGYDRAARENQPTGKKPDPTGALGAPQTPSDRRIRNATVAGLHVHATAQRRIETEEKAAKKTAKKAETATS